METMIVLPIESGCMQIIGSFTKNLQYIVIAIKRDPGRSPGNGSRRNYSIATRMILMKYVPVLSLLQCAMQEFVIVQPSYPGNRVRAIAVLPLFWGKCITIGCQRSHSNPGRKEPYSCSWACQCDGHFRHDCHLLLPYYDSCRFCQHVTSIQENLAKRIRVLPNPIWPTNYKELQ